MILWRSRRIYHWLRLTQRLTGCSIFRTRQQSSPTTRRPRHIARSGELSKHTLSLLTTAPSSSKCLYICIVSTPKRKREWLVNLNQHSYRTEYTILKTNQSVDALPNLTPEPQQQVYWYHDIYVNPAALISDIPCDSLTRRKNKERMFIAWTIWWTI